MEGENQMEWTIQQIALITGIPKDSLRYYDKLGMISPKRHENGYRYCDDNDLAALQYLTVMKYAQFTLSEIKAMVGLSCDQPTAECNEIGKRILTEKTKELKQVVANYQKIILLLEELLPMIDGVETYSSNQERIEAYIRQVYEGIRQSKTTQSNHDNKE